MKPIFNENDQRHALGMICNSVPAPQIDDLAALHETILRVLDDLAEATIEAQTVQPEGQ